MRIRILGSAAGGGLPQWNCRCSNCQAAREGSTAVRPRSQSSVAISIDDRHWFLLNVSADVRSQLAAFEGLWPPPEDLRGTSIAGCLLTDAEIDHTSGLLQLREGCSFRIFSTALVQRWLSDQLPVQKVLGSFADRPWFPLPLDEELELPLPSGEGSGIHVLAFETGQDQPRYVEEQEADLSGSVIGLSLRTDTEKQLVYAPGLATLNEKLEDAASGADCLLVDGTFWTDTEPVEMGISQRSSLDMGHLPVDGPGGSLQWLAKQDVPHRVYVHINNTNPMLNEQGQAWRTVNDLGIRIAADGDEIVL
ncbi:MAG: pyrroloquinoline quinone biosynthesis protein PqqB [Planctomycetota bacterium]|nr:pyrroloquinoline quinone biosynthesis protein PqqB [Planctomycetota bacterium]